MMRETRTRQNYITALKIPACDVTNDNNVRFIYDQAWNRQRGEVWLGMRGCAVFRSMIYHDLSSA